MTEALVPADSVTPAHRRRASFVSIGCGPITLIYRWAVVLLDADSFLSLQVVQEFVRLVRLLSAARLA